MSFLNKMKSANPFTDGKRAQRWLNKGVKKGWIKADPSFSGQMKSAGIALKNAAQQLPTPVKVVAGIGAIYALGEVALEYYTLREGRAKFEGHRVSTPKGRGRCLEFARCADKSGGYLALIQDAGGPEFYVPIGDVKLDELRRSRDERDERDAALG